MGFTNKVKTKDGTEYDIQDARIPEILAENEGKVIAVEDGALTFKDAPSGTKLYKHEIHYKEGIREIDIIIVNNNQTSFTKNLLKETINNKSYISMHAKQSSDTNYGIVNYANVDNIDLYIWYWSMNEEKVFDFYSEMTDETITDTVTPL